MDILFCPITGLMLAIFAVTLCVPLAASGVTPIAMMLDNSPLGWPTGFL